MAEQISNAKEFPKIFYCRHMLPGVVRYENLNKETGETEEEFLFIDVDAMKRAAPSMVGKPVYVYHQKVDLQNIHNADGYVVECFYNELDGWLWAKFLAVSDEAQKAIANKWSVSNAYLPKEWDESGQHLNVDYHRKIRNHEFTHLAIVPNPRYEEAKIYTPDEYKAYNAEKRAQLEELQNSKPNKEPFTMFFRSKKEEVKAGDTILDTDFCEVKNDDGTTEMVTVGDLKKAKLEANLLAKEKENAKKNEKLLEDDEEVEVDGEKVNVADLKECYKNNKMKKNEAEEEDKKKKAEEEKENSKTVEQKKKDEADAAKRFAELQNASNKNNKNTTPRIELQSDKVKRGKERY